MFADDLTACFLTFRTYGSWLHGDPRGSQDRYRNVYGTPLIPPTLEWQTEEYKRLLHPPLTLDGQIRQVIHDAIVDKCRYRQWLLHALNVRTRHVHVVLTCPCSPKRALDDIKTWCTRQLRVAGLVSSKQRLWARHGSTVYLFRQNQYEAACRYIRDEQGGELLKMDEIEKRYTQE